MELEIKKGYKVVSCWDNVICSAIVDVREGGIVYEIGKFVSHSRGSGPLAVFKEYRDADSFKYIETRYGSSSRLEIFTCEYKPSSEKRMYNSVLGTSHIGVPHGTDFADEVKLEEKKAAPWSWGYEQ